MTLNLSRVEDVVHAPQFSETLVTVIYLSQSHRGCCEEAFSNSDDSHLADHISTRPGFQPVHLEQLVQSTSDRPQQRCCRTFDIAVQIRLLRVASCAWRCTTYVHVPFCYVVRSVLNAIWAQLWTLKGHISVTKMRSELLYLPTVNSMYVDENCGVSTVCHVAEHRGANLSLLL